MALNRASLGKHNPDLKLNLKMIGKESKIIVQEILYRWRKCYDRWGWPQVEQGWDVTSSKEDSNIRRSFILSC